MGSPQYNHHFSIKNLPFGIASSAKTPQPQYATRLESTLVFLDELQDTGFFAKVDQLPNNILQQSTLNTYSALPKSVHQHVRTLLQKALSAGNVNELPQNTTEDVENVTTYLPFSIGEFTGISPSIKRVKDCLGSGWHSYHLCRFILQRRPFEEYWNRNGWPRYYAAYILQIPSRLLGARQHRCPIGYTNHKTKWLLL